MNSDEILRNFDEFRGKHKYEENLMQLEVNKYI